MNEPIRIVKDENGSVVLRFDKREGCVSYTLYFRCEGGRFKPLITTDKTAIRVNCVDGLCFFRITGHTENGRTVNIGTADTSVLMKKTSFITMGSYNIQKIVERSPKFSADNTLREISPLTAFFPGIADGEHIDSGKKAFGYIEQHHSDYFIFDFYKTAVQGIIKTDNSFLTAGIDDNDKLGEKLPKILPPEVYEPLVEVFAAQLLKLYPSDRIILVRTVSPEFYAMGRQMRRSTPKKKLNAYLDRLESYFIKLADPIVIDLCGMYFGDLCAKSDGKEAVFDRFFLADSVKALSEITSGEPGKLYCERDVDSRLSQILCYYDSASSRGMISVLLDRKNPADSLMFYTSREFIAENKAELKDIILQEYTSVSDIYRYYDFGDNIEMKNVVKVIAALESNTLQKISHGELIRMLDRQYRIKRPIANFIRATLESALDRQVDVNEQNLRFMIRLTYDLWNGGDAGAVSEKIEEYERIHNFTLVDMWGTGISKRSLSLTSSTQISAAVGGESFVWAFDKPDIIDEAVFDTTDESGPMAKAQLMRTALQRLAASPARWFIIDFANVIADNARYCGNGFSVDKKYTESQLFSVLGKSGAPIVLDYENDKQMITDACDKLADFAINRYGRNIILCKTSLNSKMRDLDGKIKSLPTDKKTFANAKAILELCEERFAMKTDCYILNNSKNYISDENFSAGGAGIARYEADFYSSCADYIDYIVQYSPAQKYYDKL